MQTAMQCKFKQLEKAAKRPAYLPLRENVRMSGNIVRQYEREKDI